MFLGVKSSSQCKLQSVTILFYLSKSSMSCTILAFAFSWTELIPIQTILYKFSVRLQDLLKLEVDTKV